MIEMLTGLGTAALALRNYMKKDREEAAGGAVAVSEVAAAASAAASSAREAADTSAATAAAQAAEAAASAEAVARYERLQSVADAAYLIAAADGTVSDAETSKLQQGLVTYLGEEVGESATDLLAVAKGRLAERGQKGLAASIASAFDADMRKVVFMVAAGISWLDRGIGVKEGLALQALSGAFDIPMTEMHKLLGAAKNI
jgi:hypothetical protein